METPTCATCDQPMAPGQPRFWFEGSAYHIPCVPAEFSSRAQSLLGVKSC